MHQLGAVLALLGDIARSSPALLASLLAAAIATLGLLTVVLNIDWARRNRAYFSAFAAGVLVTTAIALIPQSVAASQSGLYFVLSGYLGLYFMNFIFAREHSTAGFVIAPIVAIGLHSFIDGMEYGILFHHEVMLGLMASIGLITHEFAEAVILFLLLKSSRISTAFALLGAFIGAALTTPLGTLTAEFYLDDMNHQQTDMFLAIAAGALLYVGATHLTGHLRDGDSRKTLLAYALGVMLALFLSLAHHSLEETTPFDNEHSHEKSPPPGRGYNQRGTLAAYLSQSGPNAHAMCASSYVI